MLEAPVVGAVGGASGSQQPTVGASMIGKGFKLFVTATDGKEIQVSSLPNSVWFFQDEYSAAEWARHYKRLGLQTRIEEFEVEYDDR